MDRWTRRETIGAIGAAALAPAAFAKTAEPVRMWLAGSGQLVAEITINGERRLAMLDNGLANSALALSYAKSRQLESNDDLTPDGQPYRSRGKVKFVLGPNGASEQAVLIDLTPFDAVDNRKVVAIIGRSLLKQSLMVMDFDNNALSLFGRRDDYVPPPAMRIAKLGKIDGELPGFSISIEGVAMNAVIDLGSYAPLMVTDGAVTKAWIADGRKWSTQFAFHQGVMQTAQSTNIMATVKSVNVSGFELKDVPIESYVPIQPRPDGKPLAVIGPQFLSRFLATLDLSQLKLGLAPGREFATPFWKNLIGIGMRPTDEGAVVMHVGDNSPGLEAGFKRDEVIRTINGQPPSRQTLRALKAGEEVVVEMTDGTTRKLMAREYY